MIESLILGAVQGVTEWLPISSSASILLVKNLFFNDSSINILQFSLFLHLGTFFAALVYFRKDVFLILKTVFQYNSSSEEDKKVLRFLVISSLITGVLGFFLIKYFEDFLNIGPFATFFVGLFLIITGVLQLKKREVGKRDVLELKTSDGLLLGVVQALSALPGFSRSGFTVAVLVFRKFKEDTALRLSFLMSLPVVLGGNIFLNISDLSLVKDNLPGLFTSFVFGLLTIDILLRLARKYNFGRFVIFFGLVAILASLLN